MPDSIWFQVHGINLQFFCKPPEAKERIISFLREFQYEPEASPTHYVRSVISTEPLDPETIQEIREKGKHLLTYEKLLMYRLDHQSLYTDDYSHFVYDRKEDHLQGFLHEQTLKNALFFENTLFSFILWEILSLKNLFLLHAGCVQSPEGKSILLPANSRQGKTTLSLTLASMGYQFLSDDMILIDDQGVAHAFPRDLHVDPNLARHFPELQFLNDRKPYFPLNPKRSLTRQEFAKIFPQTKLLDRVPQIDFIVFPQIKPVGLSKCTSVSKGEALSQLIPPSALVLIGDETTPHHIRGLKHLVERALCYNLALGKDIYQDPKIIEQILKKEVVCCN